MRKVQGEGLVTPEIPWDCSQQEGKQTAPAGRAEGTQKCAFSRAFPRISRDFFEAVTG